MVSLPSSSRWRAAAPALLLVVALAGAPVSCTPRPPSEAPAPAKAGPPDTLPPLDHPPLDPPLRITSTFGEYRRGHFHAGLDFSTDRRVGLPVYAPVSGFVERIRTSGRGFGRSLTLRAPDGRTILLAHLDAFDEPIASRIAAAQDSSGQYEQDLAVAPGDLVVRAGQRIAWTGSSGAGPPHLHMEIRHGDLAYNPLRFGLTLPDSVPPVLRRATLEPLDDTSYVAGSAAPRSFTWPADTVVIEGRVRAWLEAADGVSDPWPRAAPYAASLDWNGSTVECRFDRIAWDDDMSAVDWVYDGNGRVSSSRPLGLWIAPDYRPSVLTASPGAVEAGVIAVHAGDPPRALGFAARDAAGNRSSAQLVVRPPRADEHGPRISRGGRRMRVSLPFDLMPVGGAFVRIGFSGAAPGSRGVEIGWSGDSLSLRPASFDGRRWWAVVRVPPRVTAVVARGWRSGEKWEQQRPLRLAAISPAAPVVVQASDGAASWTWSLPARGAFAAGFVFDSLELGRSAPGLVPRGPAWRLSPAGWPLRLTAKLEVSIPGQDPGRGGLYFERAGGWSRATPTRDSIRPGSSPGPTFAGEARGLGRFAVLQDTVAPRIGSARALRLRTAAPNRWALQCRAFDRGSGLDPARTHFVIDGRVVPSEWDSERGVLSWRPLHAPGSGTHRYEIVAVDFAGLESRRSGSLVVP